MIQNPLVGSLHVVIGLPAEVKSDLTKKPKNTLALDEVDMGEWAYSLGNEYLFTRGASPCLNVVVHNRNASKGALAHVSYYGTTEQLPLYNNVARAIVQMIQQCQTGPGDHFDIWFGSGWGFHHTNTGLTKKVSGLELVPFLQEHTIDKSRLHFITDHFLGLVDGMAPAADPDPGDVIYHCASRRVIILFSTDLTALREGCSTYQDHPAKTVAKLV